MEEIKMSPKAFINLLSLSLLFFSCYSDDNNQRQTTFRGYVYAYRSQQTPIINEKIQLMKFRSGFNGHEVLHSSLTDETGYYEFKTPESHGVFYDGSLVYLDIPSKKILESVENVKQPHFVDIDFYVQ